MTEPAAILHSLIAAFRRRRPQRAGSLIVTIFGDMIAPRGGQVLLGDLAPLLRAFAINDSQARTALSRLVADGWLGSERIGRTSLYRLTASGARRFAEATQRIYFGADAAWDGGWTIALLAAMPKAHRETARLQLRWQGFGALDGGSMIHPRPDLAALTALTGQWPMAQRPLIVHGQDIGGGDPARLRALARDCWPMERLERDYRAFDRAFAPLAQAMPAPADLEAFDCACARVLLVHEYRRVILRDPLLPSALLAEDWPGHSAYATARAIYRRLVGGGELWIDRHLKTRSGPLPPPGDAFHRRFS